MKARVYVTLKNGVLDPQGKAVEHALTTLGFEGVGEVRIGKFIEIELADGAVKTKENIEDMCKQLLANTVIENFDVEIIE